MRRPREAQENRIDAAFRQAKARGEAALVTYVMTGDPSVPASRAMALACVEGGADLIELGMPFSDPIADGPTVQKASERALAAGARLQDCLALAKALRQRTDVPIALMGYVNPALSLGLDTFLQKAAAAGVDACIFPDLPPEEAEEYCALAQKHGIRTVFLLAPTSTPERVEQVFRLTTGFVYFVSVTGVTGARQELPRELTEQLQAMRQRSPVPLVVGFGIARPDQVSELAPHVDGVVVGSAIVSKVAEPGTVSRRAGNVKSLVRSLKKATGHQKKTAKRR